MSPCRLPHPAPDFLPQAAANLPAPSGRPAVGPSLQRTAGAILQQRAAESTVARPGTGVSPGLPPSPEAIGQQPAAQLGHDRRGKGPWNSDTAPRAEPKSRIDTPSGQDRAARGQHIFDRLPALGAAALRAGGVR